MRVFSKTFIRCKIVVQSSASLMYLLEINEKMQDFYTQAMYMHIHIIYNTNIHVIYV